MLELEISKDAENDLLDIWPYIAKDQPVNADRFIDKIHEKLIKLTEFPELGKQRPELTDQLRSFPVDLLSYV